MPHFQAAFENAKYRAGKNQYKLVNQYVEVAAKNDDRRGFKKGIEWAQYLDIMDRPEFCRHSVAALRVAPFKLYR